MFHTLMGLHRVLDHLHVQLGGVGAWILAGRESLGSRGGLKSAAVVLVVDPGYKEWNVRTSLPFYTLVSIKVSSQVPPRAPPNYNGSRSACRSGGYRAQRR